VGGDAEGAAILQVRRLARQVQTDIENLELDPDRKRILVKGFKPYEPLISMSYTSHSLESLLANVYSPESLNSLMTIDMVLDGKITSPEHKEILAEIEVEISEIIEKVMKSDLPKDVMMKIYRRLEQVKSTVSHYRFWGKNGLKVASERLAGALLLNLQSCKSDDTKSIIDRIGSFIGSVRKITENVDKTVESAGSIGSQFEEHYSTLQSIASSSNVVGE